MERLENGFGLFFRYADARIDDFHRENRTISRPSEVYTQRDLAVVRELLCIAEQFAQNLLQARPIHAKRKTKPLRAPAANVTSDCKKNKMYQSSLTLADPLI